MQKLIYFDGQHSKGRPAHVERVADQLIVVIDEARRSYEWAHVQWPEPTGQQVRVIELPEGASLQCLDVQAFDQWLAQYGHKPHWIALWPTRLRWVMVSLASMATVVFVMAVWGIPWLAMQSVPFVPTWVDEKVGDAAMATLDGKLLKPSTLSEYQQEEIRAQFAQLISLQKGKVMPVYRLYFRGEGMGANAFALPGGHIVLTDELVELVDNNERVLAGVLAHELGHVHFRHGMQSVVKVSALGVLTGVLLGDFSNLLAGVPLALGSASYSRDAETQADAFSAQMLRNGHISPKVMITLFEKFKQRDSAKSQKTQSELEKGTDALQKSIPIAFASHPADADRVAYFLAQAAQCKDCQ